MCVCVYASMRLRVVCGLIRRPNLLTTITMGGTILSTNLLFCGNAARIPLALIEYHLKLKQNANQ